MVDKFKFYNYNILLVENDYNTENSINIICKYELDNLLYLLLNYYYEETENEIIGINKLDKLNKIIINKKSLEKNIIINNISYKLINNNIIFSNNI